MYASNSENENASKNSWCVARISFASSFALLHRTSSHWKWLHYKNSLENSLALDARVLAITTVAYISHLDSQSLHTFTFFLLYFSSTKNGIKKISSIALCMCHFHLKIIVELIRALSTQPACWQSPSRACECVCARAVLLDSNDRRQIREYTQCVTNKYIEKKPTKWMEKHICVNFGPNEQQRCRRIS